MHIQGKVIVVTGAAAGIGAALCRRFADEGAAHIVAVDRDAQGAAATASAIGGEAAGIDVTDDAAIADLVAKVEATHGRIDLFCSNAGVGDIDPDKNNVASSPNGVWQRAWDVNVMAHVYAARAVIPNMVRRGEGYILNTVSAAGLLSQIGGAAYSTTKHAAIGFAESVAITHGGDGIRVSVLCPQGVDTAMLRIGGGASQPQNVDGVLSAEDVARCAVEGIAAEKFLILPHPIVLEYMQRKTADYDRWIGGMRRLRSKFAGTN